MLGRITGYASAARKPVEFTIAPADAINKLLERTHGKVADVDLWEINEAFAVVAIGEQPAAQAGPLQGERARRRGGARPPDWRLGSAPAGHAALHDEGPGQEARRARRSASAAARASP